MFLLCCIEPAFEVLCLLINQILRSFSCLFLTLHLLLLPNQFNEPLLQGNNVTLQSRIS